MIKTLAPGDCRYYLFVCTQTFWDGAWHALTVSEDLPRFTSFYIGSAEYLSALAVSCAREYLLHTLTYVWRIALASFCERASRLAASSLSPSSTASASFFVVGGTIKDATELEHEYVELDSDSAALSKLLLLELFHNEDGWATAQC